MERMDKAAAEVTRAGAIASGVDTVTLSAAAHGANAGAAVREPDLVEGMLDLRVAKYAAVANMRVLSTASEVETELIDVLGRRR